MNFKILDRLNIRAIKLINFAISVLINKQTVCNFKIYRNFLNNIIYYFNCKLALLYIVSFNEYNITNINAQSQISLVYYLKSKKASLSSLVLNSLVTQYKLLLEINKVRSFNI